MSNLLYILIILGFSFTTPVVTSASTQDSLSTPESIDKAVQILFDMIPNKEIAIIRRTTEEEFSVNALSTLGVFMKEEWELYSQQQPLTRFFLQNEIYNPDEMAEIILICFWRHINGKPMNVDRLILQRMRYWDGIRTIDEP